MFFFASVSLVKGNLRGSRDELNHILRDIDDAFRRRFEKRVLIGLPSLIARKNLLDLNLKNVSLDDSVDLEEIAKLLDAYSGKESARIIILFQIKILNDCRRRFGIENASFCNEVIYRFSSIETKFSEFFHMIFVVNSGGWL